MPLVGLVLEAVVIEHPNCEDVLAIVPDVQHQPAVIDVADQDVSDTKHRQVRTHVKRVGDWKLTFAVGLKLFFDPRNRNSQGECAGRCHEPERNRKNLHFSKQILVWRLIRTIENSPHRHRINRQLREAVIDGDRCLASVDARNAVTLTSVVPPLPVQVSRRQDPRTEDGPSPNHTCEHNERQPYNQEPVFSEAFFVKREASKSRDDMVVAKQPAVHNKNCWKQAWIRYDKPAGDKGNAENSQNVGGVERKPAQPAHLPGVNGD